jgi:hypothetical protein
MKRLRSRNGPTVTGVNADAAALPAMAGFLPRELHVCRILCRQITQLLFVMAKRQQDA